LVKAGSGEICNNAEKCFCVGNVCVVGDTCSSGNAFVDGKPICDDSWGRNDATVFCRTMGYLSAKSFTRDSRWVW